MTNVQAVLEEREKTHGDYEKFCEMYQKVMAVIEAEAIGPLTPTQVTSVQMIVYKLCRILNGKANHRDHWSDIEGYASLISRTLRGDEHALGNN